MKVLTVDTLPESLQQAKVIDSVVATGAVAIESNDKGLLSMVVRGETDKQTVHTIINRLIQTASELGGNIVFGLKINTSPVMIGRQQHLYYTISGTVAAYDEDL